MQLAILSRSKSLHSIRRLLQEAQRAGVKCDVINPLECQIVVKEKHPEIWIGSEPLTKKYSAVLPRIGASITEYGLSVVRQFESMGMKVVNPTYAISESRNKMRCLQILCAAGVQVPPTILARNQKSLKAALQALEGPPVVLKLLQGTQGVGVMIVQTPNSLSSVLDTFHSLDQDLIMQRFLAEGKGRDYRAFVIGNKVVAAMMRTAPKGEFRSNIHRGGEGKLVKLPRAYQNAALKATRTLGLGVAGVDLMESKKGPVVLEVNSSPGFEGIERATGLNIAAQIIKFMMTRSKPRFRRSS